MSTPYHLFKIAEQNPIAANYLKIWRMGNIEWEFMLHEIAKAIEKQCNHLVDENNLREMFSKEKPNYVLEKSLIPDLFEVKNPLERQRRLIEAIALINEYYKIIVRCVMASKTLDSSATPSIHPLHSGQ